MTTTHIVQQFERQGKRLVAGRSMQFGSAEEAIARAERDAARCDGVAAITQRYDDTTDTLDDEPEILAVHGQVPPELEPDL